MEQIKKDLIDGVCRFWTELVRLSPVLLALCALGAMVILNGCGADNASASLEPEPESQPESQPAAEARILGNCSGDDDDAVARPEHWTEASHCPKVAPDYDKLFDDTLVQRIDIAIDPETYQQSQDNLGQVLGGDKQAPGHFATEDPMWFPVTVQLDGKRWDSVGMRFKGNSSLASAWRGGIKKLAFRLTFDKFEDDHPELDDQRFYGFKKMTFSNGFKDDSLLRDKLAADIFRAAGIPAARGAFARVYVDHGEGPIYFGLYTMIEDPSDELLEAQFGDDSGNLYKPESAWDKFDPERFEKKTNEKEADWSDVQAAIDALHAPDRTTDAAAWRKRTEGVFDVRHFLRWLAMNTTMENWDSYAAIPHNYYVYADPSEGGVLKWIPWDLNEAMLPGQRNAVSVMLDEVSADRPLIRYLLDDDVYRAIYKEELAAAVDGPFSEASVTARIHSYHELIAPYVTGAEGEKPPHSFLRDAQAFDRSLEGLLEHVRRRRQAVSDALQ